MPRHSYYKFTVTQARLAREALAEKLEAGDESWSAQERAAAREAMGELANPFTRTQALRGGSGRARLTAPVIAPPISMTFVDEDQAVSATAGER